MTATSHSRRVVRALHHDPQDRPFIVIWEVTRACQLACQHCRAEANPVPHPSQLSTQDGRRLLEQVAEWGKPHPIMILTGGDPFERADLDELVAYGSSLGLHMALSPSATPNLTRERLVRLREAGANALSLSLDGAHAQTHDSFRGFPGTFDKTIAAARLVQELGYRLQVNTTVTSRTVRELPETFLTVRDLGAALWSVFFLVPTGRGQALEALTPPQVEDVMHWLHDLSVYLAIKTTEAPHFRRVALQRAAARAEGREYPLHGELYAELTARTAELVDLSTLERRVPRPPIDVNSGRGFVFIDHVGDVYPSGFLPQRCGSVRTEDIKDIYRDTPLLQSLRTPSAFGGKCGVCTFHDVCGGSRSHAYAVTGDPLASDPTCLYVPEGWTV